MIPSMSKQRLYEIRIWLNRAADCERRAHALETEPYCGFTWSLDFERELHIEDLKERAAEYLDHALELEAEHESAQRLKASLRCAAA